MFEKVIERANQLTNLQKVASRPYRNVATVIANLLGVLRARDITKLKTQNPNFQALPFMGPPNRESLLVALLSHTNPKTTLRNTFKPPKETLIPEELMYPLANTSSLPGEIITRFSTESPRLDKFRKILNSTYV